MNPTGLAPWAVDPWRSRGRRIDEGPAAPRTEHQRDRDRIVHSTAFRRLVYKTQVFVNHEGDLFRTRLTHSLEVAQLGRSIARQLRLNEELIEALALAHDLGHTPFGHAGQDVLNQCMADHGGFEHNLQSLRVVDKLEQRYPEFDGLNLSFETREGILKHCSRHNAELMCAAEPDGPARRFLDGTQPSLEAQIVNLADEVAYNAHDVDDGVRSGLITMEQLDGLALYARFRDEALAAHPKLLAMPPRRLLFETLRRMLSALVYDLIDETNRQLAKHRPEDADALRQLPRIAAFSDAVREPLSELKRFLFKELYRHPQVVDVTARARTVVAELFAAYVAAPQEMPADFAGASDFHRAVADYIAGMTDRFALREHQRLTGRDLFAL
ncbi:deoxyguanosinetriphosphate triphosphohydrolase [Rubrivivax gelatinosus]|uniref:Deoxyguanosinetriphosphate triphosphohydrolase-like protein n=1 Tax=Rubrivivax gelatinosus (strain NBRC 100245 / IL144) TaxID=983917 RepID=I0HMD0_RUBGI|nr:deoxyguanosinetriphosphate triphosphohydrolase [Rubrivivax gelatinosus]BAL94167.1 putative deoxyguanosinetriphosphate triphosphohydrolase Dgt [Rubrivivax gelatinosus IL144]